MTETLYGGPVLREIMRDPDFKIRFPDGPNGVELYDELVKRGTNVATSATVLDVIDYMRWLYGPGTGS